MLVALTVVILVGMQAGCTMGAVSLYLAVSLLLEGAVGDVSSAQYILLAGFLLSVPAAAYLAGALLDEIALPHSLQKLFRGAGMILAYVLFFHSPRVLDYFSAVLFVLTDSSPSQILTVLVALLSGVFFCGGLVALSLGSLLAIFEGVFGWLQSVSNRRMSGILPAARPLGLLLLLSLSIHLISDTILHELWPDLFVAVQ